jgi:hypothetical protein
VIARNALAGSLGRLVFWTKLSQTKDKVDMELMVRMSMAILGVLAVVVGCSNPVGLDTESHEITSFQITAGEIEWTAITGWRFISRTKIENGVLIQGAWRNTFTNNSTKTRRFFFRGLAFKDREEFSLAQNTFRSRLNTTLAPGQAVNHEGTFEIGVASTKIANSVIRVAPLVEVTE